MIQHIDRWYRTILSDPQRIYLLLLLITGSAIVIYLGDILLPVFASIVIAYLLDGVVVFMERRGTSRRRAIALVFMVFMAVLMFIFFAQVPLLYSQIAQLIQELPGMVEQGQKALQKLPQHYPLISQAQVDGFINLVSLEVRDISQNMLTYFLASLPGLISFLFYLVLLPLLVFFFLKDKKIIMIWVAKYLPEERGLLHEVWQATNKKIGGYLRGKFWEILIVGAISSGVFLLIGLDYALLLGALVGLSVIVPFIGAIVVTFPVVIIGFFQWGWGPDFFYLLLAYGLIQALDAAVLVPLLFSGAVNLHPISIIVAVLFFGGLWGFWGVFFAIPLAALVQVTVTLWPRVATEPNGLHNVKTGTS